MTAFTWTCVRPGDLVCRHYDDGCVVYDDASGAMNCLTPVAGQLLTLLLSGPAQTTVQLAQALLGEMPVRVDQEMVDNVLSDFQSLSLVERTCL